MFLDLLWAIYMVQATRMGLVLGLTNSITARTNQGIVELERTTS